MRLVSAKRTSLLLIPLFRTLFKARLQECRRTLVFLSFIYDVKQDKILLVIDKFDSEFLHINSLTAGVGSNDIGLDRGQLGGERIVKFERRGPKVLMVEPNYRYRANSDNADEKRAVQEAFRAIRAMGF